MEDPVGSSAGVLGLSSAGLGSQSDSKKIKVHVESVYSHGPLYKKMKLSGVSSGVVDLSAGPLSVGSEVDSEEAGVSEVLDVKDLENTVAEEMSYVDPNASKTDNMKDNATPRKTCMRTFILEQPPKVISFTSISDNNSEVVLSGAKFAGSNWLPPAISRVLVHCIFGPVKLFALDIELSKVLGKTNSDKLISIKNFFYYIDGFRGALTSSKFPGIIRSTFTSESSLNKAKLMAVNENIIVNSDLKKINIYLDWKVIIKEISVDLPKSAIEAVFSKFGVINSIKIQLIGLWQKAVIEFESAEVACLIVSKWSVLVEKDSVQVALTVGDKQMWVLKDYHQVLLYILLIGMTAHDLTDLLESYGGKMCFIGHNSSSYAHDRCAIICFKNEASKLAVFGLVLVFKKVSLRWAGLSLAHCTACKQYDHTSEECPIGGNSGSHGKKVMTNLDRVCLARIYKKKQAPVTCSVSFGGRTWVLVVDAPPVSSFHDAGLILGSNKAGKSLSPIVNDLEKHLVNIESSLISLAGQIGELAKRLDSLMPAVPQPSPGCQLPVTPPLQNQGKDIVIGVGSSEATNDEAVNTITVEDSSVSPHVTKLKNMLEGLAALVLSLSAYFDSLVLAGETKLKDKACPWLASKFDGVPVFSSGLNSGYVGIGVAIVMNNSLAKHVCNVSKVSSHLLFIRLLFKNKLLVLILGLYAGVSLTVWFSQTAEINSLIIKTVNKSFFVILGGDFNEDSSHKCASFRKCHDLGLINSLGVGPLAKQLTWNNSRGIVKIIDYVFVSSNLANAVTGWVAYKQDSYGIEIVKKSVYQYIENRINNYLFGNYNISEVRSNLYNNLVHYSHLGTEDLNSETLATYFQELNFNIIKHCEEKYPVQSKYSFDFESETETSNKGKQRLKQYSKTTPNTPTLQKTTAKHLQTPEQGTSVKLPLSITLFPISLVQPQTPSLPLSHFSRLEDFQSPRNSTQQQEPILTSANIIDYLQENESNHSESLESKETESEPEEIPENEEEMATAYIAKIPKFTGKDNDTSPQKWLDKVQKAGDANGWVAARMLKAIPYFLQGTAGEWFKNLEEPFENWQAFKDAFLQQFIDNNTSITLRNHFHNIKQETSESFIAGLKDKLIKKVHPHAPANLATAIRHAKSYEMAMEEANHTKLVNLAIRETSSATKKKIDQLTKKVESYFTNQ
ncbi:hypothetical protein G9A89_021552 [Geosiphon pyriformis]|nr:hypothetical protein G9A89_021552 [Geosiphon pyriformis]